MMKAQASSPGRLIRLVIADDHPLIRAGFRELMSADRSIRIVGEAPDGVQLLALLERVPADIVALDVGMPGPGIMELIRRLRLAYPAMRILVVSVHAEGELAVRALEAGAAGYVTKALAGAELLAAVKKIHSGGKYVTPSLAELLATALERGWTNDPTRLSAREETVLSHLARGCSYKEMAAVLTISPKTISTYRRRLLGKLKLKTTAELIRFAIQREQESAA
jgi:DNA-binding NarL/FixJ family response regulator